jgi:eukaryotic-like serine/threonine-protein kinase
MTQVYDRLQTALADRYRIEREIGAGGMATVYLAHDLRHDRKVALKLMSPELSAVIGAERFLAEIKLTANLSHPHILPLFDSGEADGFLFYVMPYVEGESLRSRLTREKQLPIPDAVRIAGEVASALDYAHRHGVVHRDIKPENILLHDGRALVADFGIALAASKAGGTRMTETGMSLGTPHYMSPEQAMGEREITARSDVYALGVVLYEMLTGDPPFTGSTAQAIVARVLTETPRPILPQRHTIPPEVEAAVLTALEKLPADRFGTAAEFANALTGKSTVPTIRTAATSAPSAAVSPAASAAKHPLDPVKIGLLAVALAATALVAWGWLRPKPTPQVNRFSLYLPPEQALAAVSQGGSRVAISPDGSRIVYVGPAQRGTQLWVREHDQLNATPIAGTENGTSPFFSPDGHQVGFVIQGARLRTVSIDGGPVQSLSDSINSSGGDWGTDGYIYIEVDSGIARMRASGGALEMVYNFLPRKEAGAEWPVLLPGAKGLVFRTRKASQSVADFQIVAMPLPQGEPRVLMRGVYARYSPTGHLLVITADGKLVAVPFDPDKLKLTGSPISLLEGIGVEVGGFSTNLALSNTGTLVYTTGAAVRSRVPVWVSREGVESPVDSAWQPQGVIAAFGLSPDGRAIAVDMAQGGNNAIWVKRIPSGPFSRLTFGDTGTARPTWSADGRSVVYLGNMSTNGGTPMTRRADGTGVARALLKSRFTFGQTFQTRDGKWTIGRRSFFEEGKGDIFGVREGDSTLVPLVTGPASELHPAVSADGRWLAYSSDESGTPEIYVRPFPDAASARWQVSNAGGNSPVWSHSGKELFYRTNQGDKIMSIAVHSGGGGSFSFDPPKAVIGAAPYVQTNPVHSFDVSPDDKRFLLLRETAPNEHNELIVVQNWTSEMEGRARR